MSKRRAILVSLFVALLIATFARVPMVHDRIAECEYQAQDYNLAYRFSVFCGAYFLGVADWFNHYGTGVNAIATVAIAIYTRVLWRTTTNQMRLARLSLGETRKIANANKKARTPLFSRIDRNCL
jgi:hypothetical protein